MKILQPTGWPQPRGCSNGISARVRQVFVAGMIGWDAQGRFPSADFAAQARQALENMDTRNVERCTTAVHLAGSGANFEQATGCQNLEPIIREIQSALDPSRPHQEHTSERENVDFIDAVARRNVSHSVECILRQSHTIQRLVRDGRVEVLGAMYDVETGRIDFFPDAMAGSQPVAAQPRFGGES